MEKSVPINNYLNIFLWSLFFIILSFYVVYEQATNSVSIPMAEQVVRHKNMLAGNSEFYNPWQYRIFSTVVLEGFISVFSKVSFPGSEYLPYYILRFLQNIGIFFLVLKFYTLLKIQSKYLILLGILVLGYNMSNSVFSSDLSFNTYFDILFYLLAGYLILKDQVLWIIPLMLVAALNRETSGLIPVLLIFSSIDFRSKKIHNKFNFKVGVISLTLFLVIFVLLRIYYGMPPAHGIHGINSPLEFLKFNLTFFRMYPYMFGTLAILPLLVVFNFTRLSATLKFLFWLIVPIWFVIHFLKSQAMETRLFLVPQAMVFIPATLFIIELEIRSLLVNKINSI